MNTIGTPVRAFLALALLILFSACGDVGDAPQAQTGEAVAVGAGEGETLRIDTSRSEITWRGAKVTRAHDGGFNQFDGTVSLNGDQVTGVDVTIDMASVYTDTERLTGHLKSDDFFKIEAHPTATFEADQFVPIDSAGATHLVTGNLTMAGQTNSVTFPATVQVADGRVEAEADFIIDRQRWGITYPGQPDDLIKDEIRLMFDIVTEAAPLAAAPAAAE